jgi:hypothetical protein
VHVASPSELKVYQFGRKFLEQCFCGICAVPVFTRVLGPPPEIVEKMPEKARAHRDQMVQLNPVNLHILDGVEWDEVKVNKVQGKDSEPKYVVD